MYKKTAPSENAPGLTPVFLIQKEGTDRILSPFSPFKKLSDRPDSSPGDLSG